MFEENPFSFVPLSEDEKNEQVRTQKEIAERIKATVDAAANCLNSDLFAKYRKEYAEAERGLIEIGIRLNLTNPAAYAVAAHNIFTNIKILKMLGDSVTKDSGKGK